MAFSDMLGDFHFQGAVTFSNVTLPDDVVGNDSVGAGPSAPIDAEKVEAQHSIIYIQNDNTAVVDATKTIHLSKYGGEVVSVSAAPGNAVPTGTSTDTVTVDIKKKSGTAASATVLSSAITLDTGNTIYTPEAGTLSTSAKTFSAGDILRVVINETSTGTQAMQGLAVNVIIRENQA